MSHPISCILSSLLPKMLIAVVICIISASCATSHYHNEVTYQVKVMPGDTLSSIAQRYDTSWEKIASANNIGDYRKIKVGDVLLVNPGPGGYEAERKEDASSSGFLSFGNSSSSHKSRSDTKIITKPGGTIEEPSTPLNEIQRPRSSEGKYSPKQKIKYNDRTNGGLLFGGGNKWEWPVPGPVISHYGPRGGRFHHGIDIKSGRGTLIRSVSAGTVASAGWIPGYGKAIVINHGAFKTLYGHCDTLRAREGSIIEPGEVIATVGDSGNADGYHLHFEIRNQNDKTEDPMPHLQNQPLLTSEN